MSSRKSFIQKTFLGIAGTVAVPLLSRSNSFQPNKKENENNGTNPSDLPVGFAGYTFAKFDLDTSITMMKKVDVHYLSVKDIHLPLNSSQETIDAAMVKFKAAGINVYAVGVIYMKTKEAADQAFAYAKKVGMNMIVGAPSYDVLDYAEKKVKEYTIKLAIHNHGPEDALYPGPKDVYDRIKNRDARIGLCIDIGHATRAGVKVEDAVKEYKDRLFDLHIKDVTLAEKDGKAIEVGRGVINFPALVSSLKKIGYKGISSIEFEKDMEDPMVGIAESVGYYKGVVAAER